ncbi:response regulator transcription factor [Pedobacter helvus]|uniref:Response regulator transcription factor n=1 Tax=Pedobacter helvus TaxID=2563444 RepID=A0ABW9JRL9_9SPHI|nr:helix-turn-helix transcriptional regulator [Pedobacter ureilyticus]
MVVFNSELHVLTFVFCLLEFGMCFYQLIYWLSHPKDKRRLWYLILLLLLLNYNITGGLFPDPQFKLSIQVQNIIAYGSGFLMASYFPFYFYKAFNLETIRFHAFYGVLLFLLIPYIIYFVIIYPLKGNLAYATSYGLIVPALYSIVVVYDLLRAIRIKIKKRKSSPYPYKWLEMFWVYAAVSPWVFMSAFAYFNITQWIEVLVTNLGFVIITLLFIAKSIKDSRMEDAKKLAMENEKAELFEHYCEDFNLSKREREIALLLCKGLTYREIADTLFISESTVNNHVQHIFFKTEVNRKMELQQKLGFIYVVNTYGK